MWWFAAVAAWLLLVRGVAPSSSVPAAPLHAGTPRGAGGAGKSDEAVGDLRARVHRLVERGEVGEAIAVATTATGHAPDDAHAWALLGEIHAVAGHPRGSD